MITICGLFGFKTNANFNKKMNNHKRELRRNIVESLALAMQDRGKDSTGLVGLFGNGATKLYKDTESAEKFIEDARFEKLIESNPACIIGHTRFATVGEVSKRNAHPFRRGQIIGAHNGGVENYLELNKSVQVDSEVIFALLKKHKNNYKKAFKRLSGDFAIVWTNTDERHSLYLVRDGNPLYYAFVPKLKTMFWSSTEMPLNIILRATVGKGNFGIIEVDEEKVYCFDEFLQHKKYKVSFKESERTYCSSYYGSKYFHNKERDDAFGGVGFKSDMKGKIEKQGDILKLSSPAEQGHYKEEEDDEGYNDLGYSDKGELFVGDEAARDLQRRGYEEGCSLCNTQLIGDMWIDVLGDEIYCDQCAADILDSDGGKEAYQLEKIDFALPSEEEIKNFSAVEERIKERERMKTFYG